jgi:hypothetical protein
MRVLDLRAGRTLSRSAVAMASDLLSAPFAVAAGLLAVAGVAKVRVPQSAASALQATRRRGGLVAVRAFGILELSTGALALIRPGPVVAGVGAALYLGFVVLVGYWIRGPDRPASCGCLGGGDTPPGAVHLAVNVFAAGTMLAAAVMGVEPVWQLGRDGPATGSLVAALAALATYLAAEGLPALPVLFRSYRGRTEHQARTPVLRSFAVEVRGPREGAAS